MFITSRVIVLVGLLLVPAAVHAQSPKGEPRQSLPTPPVQKVRDGVFRMGLIEIDTLKREVRVNATVNKDVSTLEFVANKAGGVKAYESALTIEANATTFNAALLLLGLDPSHARVPTMHFDKVAPKGDPVDVWVEWTAAGVQKRVRIEQFLYDQRTKTTMSEGPWVYTGSTFMNGQFLAEMDGVLIGFVHSPSPVIENPRSGAVDAYGAIILNPKLGIPGGTNVTLVVRAIGPAPKGKL
jgi:hypothetical protein